MAKPSWVLRNDASKAVARPESGHGFHLEVPMQQGWRSKMTPPTGRTTSKNAIAIATSKIAGQGSRLEHHIPTTARTEPGTPRATTMEVLPGRRCQSCLLHLAQTSFSLPRRAGMPWPSSHRSEHHLAMMRTAKASANNRRAPRIHSHTPARTAGDAQPPSPLVTVGAAPPGAASLRHPPPTPPPRVFTLRTPMQGCHTMRPLVPRAAPR